MTTKSKCPFNFSISSKYQLSSSDHNLLMLLDARDEEMMFMRYSPVTDGPTDSEGLVKCPVVYGTLKDY